ncbi:C4-dicarboxylate transporter/malic acid transport protein [Arcobacter nitrofigilis DSM 7299]|uniref:C4-dicarboxylate transporter/malic acid transport protein n=1 Tax=Arcobacter nitrofigilis (strain ATCC 33309 / DSM 7299 / CCUG 15893 / LMG 7604 / NCTC 12251 / CI) TaxID=572480 RepID=D5V1Q4_ARCNC|nr:SLAC1 anion channel family protein [Arcobacter nitrofigilis]ADG93488.1 C4-dicarboxylate transporter/malic acid transport protein [Arcobacter nitrofigilis DSM 7299]
MNNETIKLVPNRLKSFPVTMFAIVMGLAGLSLVYGKAYEVLGINKIFYQILSYFTILIFFIILITYFRKMMNFHEEVKEEFYHPIRINFFAAISISFILVSMLFKPLNIQISLSLFTVGTVLQLFFTFHTFIFWINASLNIHQSNPAWFIPIIGNLVIPIAGIDFLSNNVLMYFFSIGVFFWIIMFSIILNRIIFHDQFAQKFMPTLFILIAPPTVALLAYYNLTNSLDVFSIVLFNLGLFFTFLLFFMYKKFLKIKFFISWWAFTFPLASMTVSTLLIYSINKEIVYFYLSYFFIVSTTCIVGLVAINTLKHIVKKEIYIME